YGTRVVCGAHANRTIGARAARLHSPGRFETALLVHEQRQAADEGLLPRAIQSDTLDGVRQRLLEARKIAPEGALVRHQENGDEETVAEPRGEIDPADDAHPLSGRLEYEGPQRLVEHLRADQTYAGMLLGHEVGDAVGHAHPRRRDRVERRPNADGALG